MWRIARRILRTLAGPAACTAVACAPQAAGVPSGPVVALPEDVTGFNELLAGGKTTRSVLDQLFVRLFDENPDWALGPPSFEPRLAESIRWSDDGTEAVVELRRACWSDGRPIEAADVVWSWRAQTSDAVAWRYAQSKERIVDVEAIGPTSVRFRFASAYPGRMTDLNEGVVLPRHAWSELPFERWREDTGWFAQHLVTSGPYTVADRQPGTRLVLAAAPRCGGDFAAPAATRVTLEIVPHRRQRLERLLAGELDFVTELTPREAERVATTPGVRLLPYPHRRYEYVAWNLALPLFENREVRRALTSAIDREALVEALWRGRAVVTSGPVPSTSWAAHPGLEPLPYDPDTARFLLDEAGWTDGDGDGVRDRNGAPFAFELAANAGNPLRVDTALMIQEQLRRVGIEARVVRLDFKALVERLDDHTFEAAVGAWDVDTSLDLTYAFHSASVRSGYNSGGYMEPEVDRLIEETRVLEDRRELLARLHRLQELLHRDQPYTFLAEPQGLDAARTRLRGYRPSALGSLVGLHHWWLAPG